MPLVVADVNAAAAVLLVVVVVVFGDGLGA